MIVMSLTVAVIGVGIAAMIAIVSAEICKHLEHIAEAVEKRDKEQP